MQPRQDKLFVFWYAAKKSKKEKMNMVLDIWENYILVHSGRNACLVYSETLFIYLFGKKEIIKAITINIAWTVQES